MFVILFGLDSNRTSSVTVPSPLGLLRSRSPGRSSGSTLRTLSHGLPAAYGISATRSTRRASSRSWHSSWDRPTRCCSSGSPMIRRLLRESPDQTPQDGGNGSIISTSKNGRSRMCSGNVALSGQVSLVVRTPPEWNKMSRRVKLDALRSSKLLICRAHLSITSMKC